MIIKISTAGVKTIWDEKTDRPLCTFKDGILDTDDKKIIAELEARGLVEKGEPVKVEKESSDGDNKRRTKAKDKREAGELGD